MAMSPSNVAVVAGSRVSLGCETTDKCRWKYYAVLAIQRITIYNGYNFNASLSDPERFSVVNDSTRHLILVINNTQLSDAGKYEVETSNGTAVTQLIVLGTQTHYILKRIFFTQLLLLILNYSIYRASRHFASEHVHL